jgi:hypothetical protein
MPKGVRESASDTFQISENPIPAFFSQSNERRCKKTVVIHV